MHAINVETSLREAEPITPGCQSGYGGLGEFARFAFRPSLEYGAGFGPMTRPVRVFFFQPVRKFQPMPVRIEEVNRVRKVMIYGTEDLDPVGLEALFPFNQYLIARDVKRYVLNPARSIRVQNCWRGRRNFKESDGTPVVQSKEDVQVRAIHLNRRNHIISDGMHERQSDGLGVKVDCLGGILAAKRHMIESVDQFTVSNKAAAGRTIAYNVAAFARCQVCAALDSRWSSSVHN